MTTTAEVLALPAKTASKHLPVSIRGTVTAAEPDWTGKFFVQDATGGVFVNNDSAQPSIGDVVELTGISRMGSFAPVVGAVHWTKVGSAQLPPARPVTVERLMAGGEDGQRVELTGLVRAVYLAHTGKILVQVSIGAYRIRVFPKLPPHFDPDSLIAARVRVRGTVATSFNASLRQLTAVNLFVPIAEDFVVEQPELRSPFDQPAMALRDMARYRPDASLGERVHVRGTVTLQRPGQELFIQDGSGGLHIESLQATALALGEVIDAVGFIEVVNFQPILKDAVFRVAQGKAAPIAARPVPFAELHNGLHSAEQIVMRGKLLDRSVLQASRGNPPVTSQRVVCTIQAPQLTFTAECDDTSETSPIIAAPLGSLVELRGVAALETSEDGKLRMLNLLLPDAGSVRVLETPSWFTVQRLLIGFAITCVLLVGVASWLLTVSRKNALLRFLVIEREQAQQELQQAHDQLEERVKERTEQLKVEMTVRKTAELEFRAVLTERTRLARELHDTLEQALTGIALQLDTAVRLFQRNPGDAIRPLGLARGFLRQSQLELRRSIWDLRSRELEEFDLAEALAIGCRQITDGSDIKVEMETVGEPRRLTEIVEENLLRLAQEALTNVVKHAHASAVTIRLVFGPENVSLEITDNGTGFDAARIGGRREGRFGLLGMSERAKRLGARLDVNAAAGAGTTVLVVLPLGDEVQLQEQRVPEVVI